MALAFTKRYEGSLGGKKFRVYDITHDGSATAITPANLNMNYVDIAFNVTATAPLSAASTAWADLTTNNGAALAMTALSSGAITTLVAIGT